MKSSISIHFPTLLSPTAHLCTNSTFFINNVLGHTKVTNRQKKICFYSCQQIQLEAFVPILVLWALKSKYFWQVWICQLVPSTSMPSISAQNSSSCAGKDVLTSHYCIFVRDQLKGLASGPTTQPGQYLNYCWTYYITPSWSAGPEKSEIKTSWQLLSYYKGSRGGSKAGCSSAVTPSPAHEFSAQGLARAAAFMGLSLPLPLVPSFLQPLNSAGREGKGEEQQY